MATGCRRPGKLPPKAERKMRQHFLESAGACSCENAGNRWNFGGVFTPVALMFCLAAEKFVFKPDKSQKGERHICPLSQNS